MNVVLALRSAVVCLLGALGYEASSAACELPQLPIVPERVVSTVAVLRDVARYDDGVTAYRECVLADLAAAGGDSAPPFERTVLITRHNRLVVEHRAVMAAYATRVGPIETLRLAPYLEGESQDCVVPSNVRGGVTVNDGAVVFYARGDRAFLNVVNDRCPGLAANKRFLIAFRDGGVGNSASLDSMRVCDYDFAVPYVDDFARSRTCDLGRFFPLSADQLVEVMGRKSDNEPDAAESP